MNNAGLCSGRSVSIVEGIVVDKTILIVGTYDTKNDELEYMAERITALGGAVLTMDISVLGLSLIHISEPTRPY